ASLIIPRLPPLLPILQNGPDYQLIQNPQDPPVLSAPSLPKEKEGDVFADFLSTPSLSINPPPTSTSFPSNIKRWQTGTAGRQVAASRLRTRSKENTIFS
ncbi:hypothetical protein H0H87_005164, partial [Tephrocybe sp. NHM501043]